MILYNGLSIVGVINFQNLLHMVLGDDGQVTLDYYKPLLGMRIKAFYASNNFAACNMIGNSTGSRDELGLTFS